MGTMIILESFYCSGNANGNLISTSDINILLIMLVNYLPSQKLLLSKMLTKIAAILYSLIFNSSFKMLLQLESNRKSYQKLVFLLTMSLGRL